MYLGLDIGSTNAKIALLYENTNIIETKVSSTGFNSKDIAKELYDELNNKYDLSNSKIVATGYGRVSIDFANKQVTEISCHAKGACKIFNLSNIVLIDIGGQDTKIIDIEDNNVKDFIMNDKCSAGTGRFLDVMSKTLNVDISELINLAKNGSGLTISSLCTVFAESEVISLIGHSEKKENIANAIVKSIVTKVSSQAKRINYSNKQVVLTGGLCDEDFILKLLSDELKTNVISNKYGRFAGAIGAALFASQIK